MEYKLFVDNELKYCGPLWFSTYDALIDYKAVLERSKVAKNGNITYWFSTRPELFATNVQTMNIQDIT